MLCSFSYEVKKRISGKLIFCGQIRGKWSKTLIKSHQHKPKMANMTTLNGVLNVPVDDWNSDTYDQKSHIVSDYLFCRLVLNVKKSANPRFFQKHEPWYKMVSFLIEKMVTRMHQNHNLWLKTNDSCVMNEESSA